MANYWETDALPKNLIEVIDPIIYVNNEKRNELHKIKLQIIFSCIINRNNLIFTFTRSLVSGIYSSKDVIKIHLDSDACAIEFREKIFVLGSHGNNGQENHVIETLKKELGIDQ